MSESSAQPRKYIDGAPIREVSGQENITLFVNRLCSHIDTQRFKSHRMSLDRFAQSGSARAILLEEGGVPLGIATYNDNLTGFFVQDMVTNPAYRGVGRILIGYLLKKSRVIRLTPTDASLAPFRAMGFEYVEGSFTLDLDKPATGSRPWKDDPASKCYRQF